MSDSVRRKGHSKLVGRPLDENGAIELKKVDPYKERADMLKGFDSRRGDLAEYFLDGRAEKKETIDSLAQAIQDAVEDWFNGCGVEV